MGREEPDRVAEQVVGDGLDGGTRHCRLRVDKLHPDRLGFNPPWDGTYST
ncbi:hypothetical protein GCM10009827_063940 [Dactylosporangium maewongense]|uniref:Uncharacterized protein n=1 Tax=Dactylosporangium maewongense TaxID=634393 RepID=A0ABN2BAX3_9ACTN